MVGQNLERDCAHFGFTLTEKAGELALKLSERGKLSKSDKAKSLQVDEQHVAESDMAQEVREE